MTTAGDNAPWAAGHPGLRPATDLETARDWVRGADLLPEAEPHRTTVLDFLDRHPDALHRSCVQGHLTGSAVVVDPSRGRAVVVLHRKLQRWFQPGGHADGDANLAAVALKEASEETGIDGLRIVVPAIDLDVHRVDPPGEPGHLHLDLRFLVLAPDGSFAPGNDESTAQAWVDRADLEALSPAPDPSTVRLVGRGLAMAALHGTT